MRTAKFVCDNCGGTGHTMSCGSVPKNIPANTILVKPIYVPCKECSGRGYIEHAVFTLEEANAILKHCGLTTAD